MRIKVHHTDGVEDLHILGGEGMTVSQVLRAKNWPLNTRCGERGLCKACLVELKTPDGWEERQGCRIPACEGMEVRVHESSLLSYEPQVQSGFRIGVPLAHDPLFGAKGVGLAVDIGTTTVALLAIDLAAGQERARAAAFNGQISLGDDVLTRISLCLNEEAMVGRLQAALAETLNGLLAECMAEGSFSLDEVAGWVLSGNTTMLHLALGVNPKGMGAVPFTPEFLASKTLSASDAGLLGGAPVVTLPGSAAYVGADIIAGLASSGFVYDDSHGLFVDVGTNGEMVARSGSRLIGCATAAGPAFEGSGLKCGVRAGKGALSHLKAKGRGEGLAFEVEVIGGEEAGRPIGMCGSAYVDFLAQGLNAGLLTPGGRVAPGHDHLAAAGDYGKEVQLALGQGKRPIVITEPDIAALLQAKGAIAAGIKILLSRVGADNPGRAMIAGGFGMHLDLPNAVECGLFPGFAPGEIDLVGNTSLGGAFAALYDRGMLAEMTRISESLEVIELNQDPEFEDTYIDCLVLGKDD